VTLQDAPTPGQTFAMFVAFAAVLQFALVFLHVFIVAQQRDRRESS
jgi:hypothetical protein